MKNKDYIVFSQKLAGYLMLNGCKLLKVKDCTRKVSKFVYFFPNKDYVIDHVERYRREFQR